MTKEEIITTLRGMVKHNEDEDAAIFAAIQALSKPSLPSNLDEAAQDIVNDAIDTNDTTIVKYQKLLEYLVRAGAEWMVGQGATMEITDDTEWANVDSFIHKNVTGGTIIQIRKK